MSDPAIQDVIVWQNGMVMVFDRHGQQLDQYQGHYAAVRDSIIVEAPVSASFYRGDWQGAKTEGQGNARHLTREEFAALSFGQIAEGKDG